MAIGLKVAIFMGSDSDLPIMLKAKKVFDEFGVECAVRIASAHRTPEWTVKIAKDFEAIGVKVFLAGAGMAAHLAGALAAHVVRPVIGVPLTSSASPLSGMDSLLSTVQMPPGMPVATVAIDGAKNAAYLALQILALSDEVLNAKLINARKMAVKEIMDKDAKFQEELGEPTRKEKK